MIDLAVHGKYGAVSVRDIAQRQEISAKYLERLVPLLKKAKLVHALRGLYGGLMLGRPAKEISLRDIVEALEGPICLVKCVRAPSICKRSKECLTFGLWRGMTKVISQSLSVISLAEMAKGIVLPHKLVLKL
ncbi:MAG: Rrf2 family transcriptional regulator [Candidatus Omnitrophica bacterium]|nr:Rrf2 family transcriptional regulator [Candidatus Omnitrophota bacterium]MDE2008852.1 Rrf2 family transcriptional regulator [Candidatus Omnitrophota bacterium]MDE2213585.1 Rrf2 family transcriptional regulator [Candidatus Omnitrophota bacterium]MDE2230514.1 Rrf2 family transcriptional regulator [Candidatus Omnitrophota bacterium]